MVRCKRELPPSSNCLLIGLEMAPCFGYACLVARGRPREFDESTALEQAMTVFWRHGYDAVSIDDLQDATGLARQSLYRTFGDKRSLFLRALDFYGEEMIGPVVGALNSDGRAIDNIHQVFKMWDEGATLPDGPGCMLVNTCSQFLYADEDVTTLVLKHQGRLASAFQGALKRAQDEGDVDPTIHARGMGRTFACVAGGLMGMSRMGASAGFTRDVLRSLRDTIRVREPAR